MISAAMPHSAAAGHPGRENDLTPGPEGYKVRSAGGHSLGSAPLVTEQREPTRGRKTSGGSPSGAGQVSVGRFGPAAR
jgi:hypothetical protein